MYFEQLKEKAHTLPMSPGVYIMKDKDDKVIYVGKAKHLKNRVSQYFQDSANHSAKTRMMVSKIDHFDVIIAASEFEALVLECSLIKQHLPKYNILLKDGKGYPYLRLDMREAYPKLTMVNKILDDGAEYYGPFGSRGITASILQTIQITFRLPDCNKKFPRDIGKDRSCLNYHMGKCSGWCIEKKTQTEYKSIMDNVRKLLRGNYKSVARTIEKEMLAASEKLNFELAASLRDQLAAIQALGQKQLVTAGKIADMDVIGFAQTECKTCFAVLHYCGGALLDKDYEILDGADYDPEIIPSLIKQFYLVRGFAPKVILAPADFEDRELFEAVLLQTYNKKTRILIPQRGDNVRYIELAHKNALEEAERITNKAEKINATVMQLGKILGLKHTPKRMESYDISNLSGQDIVASMVVYIDGKPCKKEYKRFKIDNLPTQDDYASMAQVLRRRFQRYLNGDKGFEHLPQLLLIDGGINHANIALETLGKLDIHIPVFGMVKDNRHRTRALVSTDGKEIRIDNTPNIFALIGNIQEETHRFAITYNRSLRSKRIKYSELDRISGIGTVRKQILLKKFKSISAISNAALEELSKCLPIDAATQVYQYFQKKKGGS